MIKSRLRALPDPTEAAEEDAWSLLLAVRTAVDAGQQRGCGFVRVPGPAGWAPAPAADADCVIDLAAGHLMRAPAEASAAWRSLVGLHLRHAACPSSDGLAVALLGQSLDGFIATHDGESRFINGEASLIHLHRLRALSDAVVIGIGTALADLPRLTTRHVRGPNAVRVVIDPGGRLPMQHGLLRDGAAETIVIRSGAPAERPLSVQATAIHLPPTAGGLAPGAIRAELAARGLSRLLIEGGGRTVARFIEAGALDRLQLAVSPLILGGGRPALPVTPCTRLGDARRPPSACHTLGADILFDLELKPRGEGDRSRERPC